MLGILAKEKYLNLRLGKEIPLQKIGTLESEDVSVIPFLITYLGEIYGFADSKGDLYFDDVNQYPFFIQRHARAKLQAFLTIFLLLSNFFRGRQAIFVQSKKSKKSNPMFFA